MSTNIKNYQYGGVRDIFKVRGMVKIGMLSAAAFALMILSFSASFLFPTAPWLKIDLSDLPALLGAFAMGPAAGICIEFIKNLLNVCIKGTDTFAIGELSNFIVGCAFVVPASIIYFKNKTLKGALIGLVAGIISMTVIACLSNYFIILPMYMKASGLPSNFDVRHYITAVVIPFNILKAVLQSIAALLLYKKLSPILHK